MLGPGSTVTHAAISLLAESRATCIWVGEQGVRYYCHGASLSRSTRLLEAQAKLVSSERSRLKVARRMYEMRFPDEDTSRLTMQQLLGKEGTRVRRAYERESARTGVPWNGRSYKVEDFESSDTVNKALSAANTSLYGVVHAIIVALGCSPGLGFVHARNERSFVYDIADLYKVEITVPLAFDLAAEEPPDIGVAARRAVRDRMRDGRFMQRCVHDVRYLLTADGAADGGPRSLAQHPPQSDDQDAVRDRMRDGRFMQRCVHDVRYLLTADGAADGGPRSLAQHPPQSDDQDVDYYADVDDIPSDIAEHPDDDDEDYRDELNLWAGRQGMVAAGTNYAQSPRSHVAGGAGADADDPLGDAFGPYRDELNLWAGRQGMVAAGTNYAQSPRSHVAGGAGADADDPLGDAFGPWEDAEPSSDDDMGVDPWS